MVTVVTSFFPLLSATHFFCLNLPFPLLLRKRGVVRLSNCLTSPYSLPLIPLITYVAPYTMQVAMWRARGSGKGGEERTEIIYNVNICKYILHPKKLHYCPLTCSALVSQLHRVHLAFQIIKHHMSVGFAITCPQIAFTNFPTLPGTWSHLLPDWFGAPFWGWMA